MRAFRAELPPTTSALHQALDHLRSTADHLADADPDTPLATVDAVILEALAEGATVDGELRQDLEALLARTLWYTGAHPALRDFVLTRAAQRAERLRGAIPPGPWASAFYRTGLPVRSCLALRDALAGHTTELAEHLQDPVGDHDAVLLALATRIAPAAPELRAWADLDASTSDVLRQWMDGDPVDQIAAAHPDAWDVVADDLDSLLPWVLTAAVEFLLVDTDLTTMRDVAHARLGISRLRYGVPVLDCCDLVRRGADRVRVAELVTEYRDLSRRNSRRPAGSRSSPRTSPSRPRPRPPEWLAGHERLDELRELARHQLRQPRGDSAPGSSGRTIDPRVGNVARALGAARRRRWPPNSCHAAEAGEMSRV